MRVCRALRECSFSERVSKPRTHVKLHVLYLRLTHDRMFKLPAMACNRSFNMLNITLVIL